MVVEEINADVLEDLKKLAEKNNFHIINLSDQSFIFLPRTTDNFHIEKSIGRPDSYGWAFDEESYIEVSDDDFYMTVSKDLYLLTHKFLNKNEYRGKKVSLDWIKGFIKYRSKDAKKDSEKKRSEMKKLIEKNKSIIKANERILPEEMPEEIKMPRNTPVNGVAGGLKIKSSDEIDNEGPLSDDWMPDDWEHHFGGPNW